MQIVNAVVAWLTAHKIGLILTWAATNLLNGIKSYPGPDANVVEKALEDFIDVTSFVARWHVSSWLKLPFTRSVVKPVLPAPLPPKGFAHEQFMFWLAAVIATTGLAATICIVASALFTSCKTAPQTVGQQVVNCAEQGAPAAAIMLVSDVMSSANASQDLEALSVQYGLPVVECIVADLIGDARSYLDAGALAALPPPLPPIAIVNGRKWLALHGAQFK